MFLDPLLCLLSALTLLVFCWHRKSSRLRKLSAGIPGPPALPIFGNCLKFLGNPTEIFQYILNCFELYPDLGKIWLGPDLFYFVSKPEFAETVLNHPGALEKSKMYRALRPMCGSGLLTAPVKIWKKNRKALLPTFHAKILNGFVEKTIRKCDVMVDIIKKRVENDRREVDILRYILSCNVDIAGETIMGSSVDVQRSKIRFDHLFDNWLNVVFLRICKLWYQFDCIFRHTKLFKVQAETVNEMRKYFTEIVHKKQLELQADETIGEIKKRPFLESLIEMSKKNIAFIEQDEILDEVNTFYMAGTDTNATSLCFTLTLLGMHEDIQQKLYDEIIDVIGAERQITAEDLPYLKYTERVIKESLRLFPGAPLIGRTVIEDIQLTTDITIPKDAEIAVSIVQMQRNPKYWSEPLRFDPDRFLPENSKGRHPYAWIPFSGGMRNCIGFPYAMMVMKCILVTLVRKFDITSGYRKVEDVKLNMNVVIRPVDGFKVRLTCR